MSDDAAGATPVLRKQDIDPGKWNAPVAHGDLFHIVQQLRSLMYQTTTYSSYLVSGRTEEAKKIFENIKRTDDQMMSDLITALTKDAPGD